MAVWQSFPRFKPLDEEIVWVRVRYYYGQPFLAQWIESQQSFWYEANQMFVPWTLVQRWKSQ